MVHLGDEVASHQICDYAFLRDLKTTLSSESVDWLNFETAAGIDDAAGQFFSWVGLAFVYLINEFL